MHLNLSNCGLYEKQIWHFGAILRRSKTLRALHLGGNPGVTPRVVEYLKIRTHGKIAEPLNIIDFDKMPSNILKDYEFCNIHKDGDKNMMNSTFEKMSRAPPSDLGMTQDSIGFPANKDLFTT